MSKDIILARNIQEAKKVNSALKLEDAFLTYFYQLLKPNKIEYPIMWTIVHDFYGDYQIGVKKLPRLIDEIARIDKKINSSSDNKIKIREFIRLVIKCSKTNNKIFFIAD